MGMFKDMLNEMMNIEASGFNPAEETYSEKMAQMGGPPLRMSQKLSQLNPNQQRTMDSLLKNTDENIEGQYRGYPKTSDDKFILKRDKAKQLLDAYKSGSWPNINEDFIKSIEDRGGEYVTPLSPNSSGIGERGINAYYEQISSHYDPVTGRTVSPEDTKEISDLLIKKAVKRGDAKVKNLIRETPDEDFQQLGVSKDSIMKQLGIE